MQSALALLLSAAVMCSGRTPRIGSSRKEEYLNPDIAIGNQFHVAARQFDGTLRCYFIDVGSVIEQGPINKRSNAQCAQAYRKEIALGRYNGTLLPEDSQKRVFTQTYVKGDSFHCGTVSASRRERTGLVDPSNGPRAKQVRRASTLVMIKNEGQVDITARVSEPRRCRYEVVLEGPELLLLGGPSGGVAPIEPVDAAFGKAPKASPTRKPQKSSGRSSAARSEAPRDAEAPKKPKASPKASAREKARYQEAASVVKQGELLSRPLKELKKLLRHLGADCRACSEKAHFVDRLEEIVSDKDEL